MDNDFTTARAWSINSLARGLGVRFLTVMISTEYRMAGNLTGNIFNPPRLALSRATEFGNSPTNLPLAMSVIVS
jgi:hypothetical protein